jgi:hypothetical protein
VRLSSKSWLAAILREFPRRSLCVNYSLAGAGYCYFTNAQFADSIHIAPRFIAIECVMCLNGPNVDWYPVRDVENPC